MDKVTLILLAAGLLGAFLRAFADNDQKTWSRQTVVDVVLGGLTGGLTPLAITIPGDTLTKQFLVVTIMSYAGINVLKDLLGKLNVVIPNFTPPLKP